MKGTPLQVTPRPALALGLLFVALAVSLVSIACDDNDDGAAGSPLAERWLRVGEDAQTNVLVYEGTVPPILSDLLNPGATEETPAEDRLAVPVHPDGELLGSYLVRRPDGTTLVWLFLDVPEANMPAVTGAIAAQLDEAPWQVIGQQGNRSFSILRFQPSSTGDVQGTAIVEPSPSSDTYDVVVARDEDEATLAVTRGASFPVIEANFSDDLTVEDLGAGLAAGAGLREGDRIVRVAGQDVASPQALSEALEALSKEPGVVSITYLLEVAPSIAVDAPAFVAPTGIELPGEFPLRDQLADFTVEQFQTFEDPAGEFYAASLLSPESSSEVANQLRDALRTGGWEIVADEPVGFATALEFINPEGDLQGTAQIDTYEADDAFTLAIIQIQTATPSGN